MWPLSFYGNKELTYDNAEATTSKPARSFWRLGLRMGGRRRRRKGHGGRKTLLSRAKLKTGEESGRRKRASEGEAGLKESRR